MKTNQVPKLDMSASETKCCPKFNSAPWDKQTFKFENKLFVKGETFSLFHIPLNFGSMMKKVWGAVQKAKAQSDEYLMLSYDPSPWKGEHYIAVKKEIPNQKNTVLSGTFMTKVFEGPYKDAPKWMAETQKYVESEGKKMKKFYMFYTTCPKCAKHYGKNYVVAFAEI